MTATTTTQPAARDNRPRRRREARAGYAFLSPWLLGFFVLTVGPMIASLYLSFTDYNLFSAPRIVGVDNYVRLFSDPNFLQAVKVTGTYVLVGTPLKLLAALAVAVTAAIVGIVNGWLARIPTKGVSPYA